MDVTLQNEVLSIILLAFEENTEAKRETTGMLYDSFNDHLSEASQEDLFKTSNFIMFIKQLYTNEDTCIVSILNVLAKEVEKQMSYKFHEVCVSL